MTDRVTRNAVRLGQGFTLTELLVAMSIGSVLLLTVLAVVRSGGEGYEVATRRVDANVEARAAMTTLAGDLSSLRFGENFVLRELDGAWRGSELSFLTLKPRSSQDSAEAAGDLCFVHYYAAVTRPLEGETGPFSRKLYRRLVSSRSVMDTLRGGGDFRDPVRDPARPEDEAVAFNVVQFRVEAKIEDEAGGVRDWQEGEGKPDFLEVLLRVTDNRTAGLLEEESDWEFGSGLAGRLLGREDNPDSGQRLRTYRVVVPVR